MFKTEESKASFLQQTKIAREERKQEKDREVAACHIQKCIRRWLGHIHFTKKTLQEFDQFFNVNDEKIDVKVRKPILEAFNVLTKFLLVYKKERDYKRMAIVYNYLVQSLEYDSATHSYIGVSLMKGYYKHWMLQLKSILRICLHDLKDLNPANPSDNKCILLRLHTLISFTSINTWAIMKSPEMQKLKTGMTKLCANIMGYLIENEFFPIMQIVLHKGLCNNNYTLQPVAVVAVMTLTMRPLTFSEVSDKLLFLYVVHIFCVPGLLSHLQNKETSLCLKLIHQNNIFSKIVTFLHVEENSKAVFDVLKGNSTVSLLANLINLANIEVVENPEEINYDDFIFVITALLRRCQQYVVAKKCNTTHWHPILGWFEKPEDQFIQETIDVVKAQLSYLWTGNLATELLCKPLYEYLQKMPKIQTESDFVFTNNNNKNIFNRALHEISTKKNNKKGQTKLNTPETDKLVSIFSLYYTVLCTLKEMRFTILTGLCYKDRNILYNLWKFLGTFGSKCGLKVLYDHFVTNAGAITPEMEMLIFFCDCMAHFLTILDDIEMYEQQDPFKLHDYMAMGYFVNHFLYKSISNNLFGTKTSLHHPIFISLHSLLMIIYRRDCQKRFCAEDHWIIKEVKISSFLADLESNKENVLILLSKMPHIIPHSERIKLFRKYVTDERKTLGFIESSNSSTLSTLISVHRSRIIEDGYRQLANLHVKTLKGVIRVRFINEQGLDEAGIDQDGVFKEFLEETIKKVFDPCFNLFSVTSDNRLFPSSTSFIHENHLELFEFVGRILGKAIYEGIVVDVPFAPFFVSQFCGQTGGALYSWLDELASLDQDLYRSLTMVKHYDGDVSELELNFCTDQNVMGQVVSYDLKPGGRAIMVTNENKINYIHLMAQFRMHIQIKDQIAAFIRGFRSVINPDWLTLFSAPELQRLISGDDVALNLQDLRKHTQYYGGFHDKHKVVCWLWDILEKDFTETERGLFLKFVTSCSKPPLLGFAYLEPPFSIRCIEVGDDEDTGDTIGSVIRGFFTIRKKDPQYRLPTSSTCFNLLKLPNYQKKSTLREKLRYAISSNTGFELS